MLKKFLLFIGMTSWIMMTAGCADQQNHVEPENTGYDAEKEDVPGDASHGLAQPGPEQTAPGAEVSPEPEQTSLPENIFDIIPTEGNFWNVNEIEYVGNWTDVHPSTGQGRIFHEMTREAVLAYFDMELNLSDILPDNLYEYSDKYGFYEFADGTIEPEHAFIYFSDEEWWTPYVTVTFRKGELPSVSLMSYFGGAFREREPESSIIQGQEVRIIHLTVGHEPVVDAQYYFAEFVNDDLGVMIKSRDVEWEEIKKVIEYLVFYALEREGG